METVGIQHHVLEAGAAIKERYPGKPDCLAEAVIYVYDFTGGVSDLDSRVTLIHIDRALSGRVQTLDFFTDFDGLCQAIGRNPPHCILCLFDGSSVNQDDSNRRHILGTMKEVSKELKNGSITGVLTIFPDDTASVHTVLVQHVAHWGILFESRVENEIVDYVMRSLKVVS